MTVRTVLLSAGLALAAIASPAVAAEPGFRPVEIRAAPIERFRSNNADDRYGALEFRGGLVLTSPSPEFGSLSGIDFSLDGSLLYAVADTGMWVSMRPVEADGRLAGVADGRIAPILDADGTPLTGKYRADAEGLRIVDRDGRETAIVSFEQVNDLRRFTAAPDLAMAVPKPVRLPGTFVRIPRNRGLEAVAVAPAGSRLAGATVVVAERALDKAGNFRAWIVDGRAAGTFAIRRIGAYDVTDAAFLPDGDLLILERKFSISEGVGMRIRRLAADGIRAGRTVDGPVLIEADLGFQIDNMEGMAVRQRENGETLIALVSDDNHNILQRTLLLFFVLAPPAVKESG